MYMNQKQQQVNAYLPLVSSNLKRQKVVVFDKGLSRLGTFGFLTFHRSPDLFGSLPLAFSFLSRFGRNSILKIFIFFPNLGHIVSLKLILMYCLLFSIQFRKKIYQELFLKKSEWLHFFLNLQATLTFRRKWW